MGLDDRAGPRLKNTQLSVDLMSVLRAASQLMVRFSSERVKNTSTSMVLFLNYPNVFTSTAKAPYSGVSL